MFPRCIRSLKIQAGQRYSSLLHLVNDRWETVDAGSDGLLGCGGICITPARGGGLCFGMIRNDLHKKGLGSVLLSYRLIKLLENTSVQSVLLDTSQYNPEFYQKFGFTLVETKENFYGQGLHRNDMRLIFPEAPIERASLLQEFWRQVNKCGY